MPTFKLTTLYQSATTSNRVGGWSETVYQTATSLAVAQSAAAAYALFRTPLLPNTSLCVGSRVSQVDSPGVSTSEIFNRPGTAGVLTDAPQMALLIRILSANGSRRNFMMRNLPDARVVSGEYVPVDTFTQVLNAFLSRLTSYQLRTRDKTVPIVSLVGVTDDGLVTTATDFGPVAGGFVEFYRTRDIYGQKIKGRFPILGTPTPTQTVFKVGNWRGIAVDRGAVRKVVFTFSNITATQIVRSVVRKVGRPFVGYSGRRSRGR